jgi:hypothetical protein
LVLEPNNFPPALPSQKALYDASVPAAVLITTDIAADLAHRIASSGLGFCSEDKADVGFMISSMPTNLEPRKY